MNNKSALKKIKNKNLKKFCEVLLAEMKRIKAPGASIGVWYQGKEQTAGFGIRRKTLSTSDGTMTRFHYGSHIHKKIQ
jgi:hypothetical protein